VDGRARFCATPYQPVAEPRESRFPFSLTTGRLRDQWHGMSRTGTIGRLFGHVPEPSLQMNPQDMSRRQVTEGDLVHVSSKRGSIVVPVQASPELGLNQVFMAMHWGEEFLSGQSAQGERLAGVNALTTSAYCPDSKQPEFKHAAVKVLKADLAWNLLAVAWLPNALALSTRTQLKALMAQFAFASCTPFVNDALDAGGKPRTGLLFRAADHAAPADAVLAQLETLLHLSGPAVVRYADKKKGQRRAALMLRDFDTGNACLQAFLLSGDTSAQSWVTTLLKDGLPAQSYSRAVLGASAQAPVAVASRGRLVCTCFNVSEAVIQAQLTTCKGNAAARLSSLQGALHCGTNCGSCLPELRRKVQASLAELSISK
jgi:assimilatory nitrate reductase catalytic subunit